MRPRSELLQQCLKFELQVAPRVRMPLYRDYLGKTVHSFDVPAFDVPAFDVPAFDVPAFDVPG